MTKTIQLLIAGLVLTFQAASTVQPKAKRIVLTDCEIEGVGKAKCGTYQVFENRASKTGRRLTMNMVVFPATGDQRAPDPIFYFAGGPGSGATEDARGFAKEFEQLRKRRDLVFVDQRGTGGSNPLNCEFYNPNDLQSYLEYFFPLEQVRKCRTELEPKADLKLYTTTIAMDDIDDVRAALGYEKINLFGGSYGTRAALTYLKRHGKSVRTAILQGVSPTDHFLPGDFALQTERALHGVLGECYADEACNQAFPKLKDEVKAVLAQLINGPIEVEVEAPESKERVKVKLNRDLAAEAIRYMLYNPVAAGRVPLMIHLAAENNWAPLAQSALMYRIRIVGSGSTGMYLSVTCAEDLPWIKPGEGERMAQNTFLGEYRLRQQREACALWPRAEVESDYASPIKSDVPVLILTGEWDPVTPPANGDRVAKTLTNSMHLVVPSGAHAFGGLENIDCIFQIGDKFIERGSMKGIDTACVKTIKRKGFVLSLKSAR
jgi:pimeloyl-ACP methyl ester carboxylesterase